jgi:YidC/Oxa1 family membrane protein insertase
MGMKEGSLDAFDTIFCAGEHIKREVRATERAYSLPAKECVEFGYPLVDDLIPLGEAERKTHKKGGRKEILIAPTWNEDNILDSCIDELLENLLCDDYHITVRPHPEYVKRFGQRMNATVEHWKDRIGEGLTFELDFSSNKSIYSSDLMITDWSGISFEFSFATKRPTLFINTKMKVLNENWQKINCTPIEITLRDEIGMSIEKSDVKNIGEIVKDTFKRSTEYEKRIEAALGKAVYNVGHSDPVGAKYILNRLVEKQEARK